jgi:general secretion pathway protein F
MVRAGELAGNLEEVLRRLADFLESGQKLKGKVQAAMVYPILMLIVTSVIMAILMVAVVPEVTSMFKSQNKTLPLNTRMLIGFSDFIRHQILFILIFGGLGIYAFVRWTKSVTGRQRWHQALLNAPVWGRCSASSRSAGFARTLGTMLSSGVPMLRALDTAKEILGNVILRKAIEDAKQAVTEGDSLAVTLKRSGHFPASMIHMVAVGERAGQLETMLQRVADAYESEVEMKLQRFTALLEPLMLVFMGGAVAFVVFSILQPIMEMGSFAGG